MGGSATALPPMLQNGCVGGERKSFEKPCSQWMIEVNRLIIDVRHAPGEIQEIDFRKGLIPWIPDT